MGAIRRFLYAPLASFVLIASGCATFQPVEEPARFIAQENPPQIHVTFTNNSRVTLLGPEVRGDSVVGRIAGVAEPVAAPLSHLAHVEAKQRDGARTTWLIAGVGVIAAGVVFGLSHSGSNDWRHPCEESGSNDCDWGTYRIGR